MTFKTSIQRSVLMQVADPPTACTKLRVPVTPVVSWIALIQRSQEQDDRCTFDMKANICPLLLVCYVCTAVIVI